MESLTFCLGRYRRGRDKDEFGESLKLTCSFFSSSSSPGDTQIPRTQYYLPKLSIIIEYSTRVIRSQLLLIYSTSFSDAYTRWKLFQQEFCIVCYKNTWWIPYTKLPTRTQHHSWELFQKKKNAHMSQKFFDYLIIENYLSIIYSVFSTKP